MYFCDVGEIKIEALDLEPAYDLDACLSQAWFRSGCGLFELLVMENKKVILECHYADNPEKYLRYEGACTDDELAHFKELYAGGEHDV